MSKKGSLPPWMTSKAKLKRQNAKSQKQERTHAQRTGGKTSAGSGSSWRSPQDVRGPLGDDGNGYLDQLKGTDKHSFSVDARELADILADAERSGREGRLIIEFYKHGILFTGVIERR